MFVQVLAAAGEGTIEPGEGIVWTGNEPESGIYECRRFTGAEAGNREHAVILVQATETSAGNAEALVFPVPRKFAAAATAGQRLANTATGLRPATAGEAVTAIALQAAMTGDIKIAAQLPAVLPRWKKWTGRTGTGLEETIAHGLGGLPDRVFLFLQTLPLGFTAPIDLTEGTHTTTDLKITVTAGVTYAIYADRFA